MVPPQKTIVTKKHILYTYCFCEDHYKIHVYIRTTLETLINLFISRGRQRKKLKRKRRKRKKKPSRTKKKTKVPTNVLTISRTTGDKVSMTTSTVNTTVINDNLQRLYDDHRKKKNGRRKKENRLTIKNHPKRI